MHDLTRFLDAQAGPYETALAEIRAGAKTGHWMWFIFPQIAGLGSSPTAAHYAIRDRAEAEAFVLDPTLGPRYRTLLDAVHQQVIGHDVTIRQLFDRPDDQKLVTSLTLFAGVTAGLGDEWTATQAQANELLDRAEARGLPRCATTQRLLADDARP